MAQVVANVAGRGMLSGALLHKRVPLKCLPRPAMMPSASIARSSARGTPKDVVARRSVVAHAKVEKITGEQLEVAIATRETTLIVDFFATWCGPCLLLARELEQVAEQMDGKVKVVKIDVDENPELSNMLKIQGLPTIVIIPKENGKPALRTEGLLPADQIMEIIAQLESGKMEQDSPEEQPQQQ